MWPLYLLHCWLCFYLFTYHIPSKNTTLHWIKIKTCPKYFLKYIFLYYKPSLIIVSVRNPSQIRMGKSKIYELRHSAGQPGRHRWLKQQAFIFLQFQRLKVPDQGTSRIEFWRKLTTLLADYHSHIPTLSLHGLSSVCMHGEREKSFFFF